MGHHILTILKGLAAIIILCLPFITLIASLGPDTLLDTYRHPDQYRYITGSSPSSQATQRYLLLKDLHQSDAVQKGDPILYQDDDGLHSATVCAVIPPPTNLVYIATDTADHAICPHDILGRITGSLDQSPWSLLALQVWDLTAHTLNPSAFLAL